MKKVCLGLISVALLWCASGCKTSEIDDPIIVPQVEKEFFLEMREQPGASPRPLRIDLRTVKVQDCVNTSIRYDLLELPSRYRLDIHGIQSPADCIPGAAQARESAVMPSAPNGLYGFDVNLRSIISNQGILKVFDDFYILEMNTEEGLVIANKQLRRIPDFTIWGYVAYSAPSMGAVATNFVNDVSAISNVASFPPGYYGHFTIPSGGGQISINGSPADLTTRSFVHRYSGNIDDLRSLVNAYRSAHGALIQIKLQTITGESL